MIRGKKTDKPGSNILGFSPWILAAACGLLLLLLSLFSVTNYQREKELINEALIQKGLTLMRFINSSARESVRQNLRSNREWVHWTEHVQAALLQAVEQPGVEFILVVDHDGDVLASGGDSFAESGLDGVTKSFIAQLESGPFDHFVTRVIKKSDGGTAFQIASHYLPPNGPGFMPEPPDDRSGRRRQMMMHRFSSHPNFEAVQQEMRLLLKQKPLYLVQLNLQQFNMPLRRQLLQVIILFVVTLLVGVGGALSFMTLKGLRGSQHRLGSMRAFTDNLISSLPVGIIATDRSGKIQICNSAARTILQVQEPGGIIGAEPEHVLPETLAGYFGEFNGNRKEKLRGNIEIALELAEGSRNIQLTTMAIYDADGKFDGGTLLIRDLTEIRKLEKDLQRSERLAALGKMAAGVAHELRNPLSSIKGLAVLLKKSFSPGDQEKDTADILVREVDRLNRSIGELLDYAKPGQLDKQKIDLHEFVDKTVSLIGMDAESYGVEIKVDMQEGLPEIMADKDKLNQVLLNLLLNSLQAMPDGGNLSISASYREKRVVCLIVEDTGTGIAPENLAKVFDPYFTTKSNGTGLGLAMSVKIVEEHGGTMRIASVQGQSTTVEIVLPLS